MPPFLRNRAVQIGLGVLLVLAVVVSVLWNPFGWFKDRPSSARAAVIDSQGGLAWNPDQTVGVRVQPGGVQAATTFTFTAPGRELPESPLGDLVDVLVPAVDIVPKGSNVTNADVIFKIDPAKLPPAPSGSASAAAPSSAPSVPVQGTATMANAGIEIFNEDLGTWVPIPTTIEDNHSLVAHAPHFSILRAVVNKIGEFTVDVGKKVYKVVQTVVMKPIDRLWNFGVTVVKDLYYSLTGQFDPAKFKCENRNANYRVTVDDLTGQKKFDACVVTADGSANTVVIKNGLALPFSFKPRGDVVGVSPKFSDDGDVIVLARNLLYLLAGNVAVSGLEVGSFALAADAPKDFVLEGQLSWIGAAVDIIMALATVFLPKAKVVAVEYRALFVQVRQRLTVIAAGRTIAVSYQESVRVLELVIKELKVEPTLAAQAQFVMAAINCGIEQARLFKIRSPGEIPGALVQAAKGCFELALGILTNKGTDAMPMVELLHSVISQTKTIFETGQLAGVAIVNLLTGKNNAKVDFRVRQIDPKLEPFVGAWEYSCGDIVYKMTVKSDYTGQWTSRYPTDLVGPDFKVVTKTTEFNLVNDGGKPTLVVTKTNEDGGIVGAKLRGSISSANDGFGVYRQLVLAGDQAQGAQYVFYQGEYTC